MTTKETKRNKSSFAANIVIFLMLALILGGGTLFWYTQNYLSSLQTNLDQSITSIKEIESNIILFEMQLKDARETEKNQSLEFLKVNASSQNNAKSIEELNDQFSRFKNISETHDEDWFLLRAKYFLTIANNELSLFGRLQIIKESLIQAKNSIAETNESDSKINELIDLALNKVNRSINTMNQASIIETVNQVESRLLSQPTNITIADQPIDYEISLPSIRNTLLDSWDNLLGAMKQLVLVKSNSDSQIQKLKSEEKGIVKSLLRLNFELIRFYALQNSDDNYQTALNNSIEKIKGQYSDQNEIAVQAINDLLLLKELTLKPEIEEIGESLLLMQVDQ
ncbi:MAG: uroporphyrinogen-III C-methyltransferase [Gammaproteobacteria bacterium]|nr:uroporphyrinogen-III C-methyltransferase [Gammaproteobacteria bacterium]